VKKKKMKNEKENALKSITVIALVMSVLVIGTVGAASAYSVYLVADHHASPTPINAYDIQPGPNLVYQSTYLVTSHALGASGLAMYNDPNGDGDDSDAQIFVTYESSNKIEVFKAVDLSYVGTITAAGASDLAGIVVDQGKKLVYTVDRYTNNLYVYNANTFALVATPTLSTDNGAVGLALDETAGLLYVTDFDPTVHVYNTNTWVQVGTITTASTSAVGIAVDPALQLVYTGGAFAWDNDLAKYDLTTNTATNVHVPTVTGISGEGAMGLAVDPTTNLLYVTTGYSGDRLIVFDSGLNLVYSYLDTENKILNPAGIIIGKGYQPVLKITKDDGVTTCINPGTTFTYTLTYENKGNVDLSNVKITDTLPAEVTYQSCTGGGVYSAGPPETVTWDIGTVLQGASGSVTVTVKVNAGTEGVTFTNFATIESDQTTPSTVTDQTTVCTAIPEFSTIAIPVASILGLLFFFNHRKRKREQ